MEEYKKAIKIKDKQLSDIKKYSKGPKTKDISSELVTVTDIDRLNFLSNSIQNLVKENIEPDLDLKISNPETKDIIIPFQKRSATDCSPIKLTFY